MKIKLNDYQTKVVNHDSGNMSVLSSAGSGKTAVIVERIKRLVANGVEPESILCISFSRKACDNLVKRTEKIGAVDVNTFHALALKIVQEASGNAYNLWTQKWEKEQTIVNIVKNLKYEWNVKKIPTTEIMAYINIQKMNMIKPTDKQKEVEDMPYPIERLQKIYAQYEKSKAISNYVEFNDLVPMACDFFEVDDDLVDKYRSKYKYVFVDEYQDVSKDQHMFLKYIANNNLMVVGDKNQAIYSFRGGSYHFLTEFDKMWDDVTVYNLPTNYRCSKDIVEASNALVRNCEYPNYVEAIANKPEHVKPVIRYFFEQDAETEFMISTICEKLDIGYEYRDFAVLSRTNAQLSAIQTAFSDKDIPFEVVGGSSYYELPEIKIFIEYLKLATNHNNNSAFAYIFNKPNRFLPTKLLDEMRTYECLYDAIPDFYNTKYNRGLNEIRNIISAVNRTEWENVGEIVEYLRNELDIDDYVRRGIDADLEAIRELTNNIDMFCRNCSKYKSISQFLYAVEQFMRGQTNNKNKNKVKLMTIHKSKGLEFPIVFVTGCSQDLLPHKKSTDIEDERRLFYVAMTRAEDELYLLHTDNSNDSIYSPSPFLNDVWDYCEVFDYE